MAQNMNLITQEEVELSSVASSPTILTGTPEENKKVFDRLCTNVVIPKLNNLITAFSEFEKDTPEIEEMINKLNEISSLLGDVNAIPITGSNLSEKMIAHDNILSNEISSLKSQIDSISDISVTREGNGVKISVVKNNTVQEVNVYDGYTPQKGVDYFDGKDGYTPQKDVDYFDGKDGYTPQKGVDYWNDADKAEIMDELSGLSVSKNQGSENVGKILVVGTDGNLTLTDMPDGGASGDVVGVLDDSNNILLSGNLADGTYTLKFENSDGTYTEIGTLEVGEIVPEPTNLFVIGGDGYILNGRCNSEGEDRTDTNGNIVTNYIDVKNGDTVYIKNATLQNSSTTGSYSCMKLTDSSVVGFYPDTTEHITNLSTSSGVTQFTVNNENADYIRLCLNISYGTATTNDIVAGKGIIITVNEPLS